MTVIGVIQLVVGVFGVVASFTMFGDISVACLIGGISALLGGLATLFAAPRIRGLEEEEEPDSPAKPILLTLGIMVAVVVVLIVVSKVTGNGGGSSSADKASTSSDKVSTVDKNGSERNSSGKEEEQGVKSYGTLGNNYVEIKGATLCEDYSGEPVIAVSFDWTNNSNDTVAAISVMSCSAFQDGIQLDTTFFADYESDIMTKVKPGKTVEITIGFLLNNSDPVEFEITKIFSRSGPVVGAVFTIN